MAMAMFMSFIQTNGYAMAVTSYPENSMNQGLYQVDGEKASTQCQLCGEGENYFRKIK